ncbi:MAG: leucine-rich repeat domain-containing protein [Eubacterium sp.]|nr:leucine-rich repeat domain-containing protein [Eubacterium sp.]
MKKIFSIILSICMLISLTAGLDFSAHAEELSSSGSCGENVTYTFDSETGALTISGNGAITDYQFTNNSPFCYHPEIKHIVIEEGVTGIGKQAFSFCENLESIVIPSTVTYITSPNTFGNCPNITSVCVSENNSVFDSRNNCNAIIKTDDNELIFGTKNTVIPNDIKKIGAYAFYCCAGLDSLTIPEGVTSIGEHAFAGCVSLERIHIPAGVTDIGSGAFFLGEIPFSAAKNNAVSFTVDSNNSVYDSRNDCNAIIETATNKLLFGCNTTVIPFTVESIGNSAFGACTGLKNITIPHSVKTIEAFAFDYAALDSVTVYNPECDIYDGQYTLFETKKICGYENSTAQQYADKYSIPFETITCEHTDTAVYKENEKPATYTEKGSYDNVTRCSTCGKELGRETVETDVLTTTLTIHWSSIDGVDLEEPVVFENVNPDLTVNEALEAAGNGRNSDFFTKDGYVEFHMLLPKPMSEYKEVGPYTNIGKLILISAEAENSKVGENGLDLYVLIYKRISDGVIADVKAPVCGVSTKTDVQCNEQGENVYISQTNNPVVSTPEDAHYHIMGYDEMETLGSMWTTQSTINTLNGFNNDPFEGTFEGGKNYFALIGIIADYGYIFPNEGPPLTVNGGTLVDTLGTRAAVLGIASVEAKHSTVTDKAVAPTYTSQGKTEGSHCSGCGKILVAQKAVPKLPKKKNTLYAKGKKVSFKLKKKNYTLKRTKVIKIKKAKGKLTYKKLKGNKKIVVNKNGKITVKKGLKKGTYKIKINVKAAGTVSYKSAVKTVIVTIKVK